MATFVIGDVQGCFVTLRRLLRQVRFTEGQDELWLAGDLVNRGAHSMEVLRFIHGLGNTAQIVLGNHELHLLQLADGVRAAGSKDTLDECLSSTDSGELVAWLRRQPLLHHCESRQLCMVHAGIPPQWHLQVAKKRARAAEAWIVDGRSSHWARITTTDREYRWEQLQPAERAQLTIDYFTAMRVCDAQGSLKLNFKGEVANAPPGYLPWFAHPDRLTANIPIVFGHWSALGGIPNEPTLQALDTGCIWGKSLTALRLDDWQRFSCPLQPEDQPASKERS